MRKRIVLIMAIACILLITGCGDSKIMSESYALTLGELKESENRELIGNQIPQWVSDAEWNKPLYVVSSSNIERFDAYALENFPDYYGDGWTQKQSDTVYLGQGIEMFTLDDATQINRIIYYPIILNGVMVGGYQVCEQLENQEISMQASPLLANELNLMMDLTSEETPLILGYNNDNAIGIIGDTCYILDIDHMFHKNVSLDKIPAIEFSTCVNVMEGLCTERTANIEMMERDADTDVLSLLDGVTDATASSSETQEPAKEEDLKEFVDYGVFGVSFNRPGIQSLLNEVKEKKVACTLVKDLFRFGRNYIEVGNYIEQIFPFLGVHFIAVSDNFDSFKSPAGLDSGFRNLMQNLLEEKIGMAAMLDAEGLTKDLVDELIERIDVYGEDRVEIKWKFRT